MAQKANMREYIVNTPKCIKDYLDKDVDQSTKDFLNYIKENKNKRIVITGCGTSCHLTILLERYLTEYTKLNVIAVPSADLTQHRAYLLDENAIVFAISHSGATKASVDAMKLAKEKNVPVISYTANEESAMAKLGDMHIKMFGGFEYSLPKTLTFTTCGIQLLRMISILDDEVVRTRFVMPSADVIYKNMTDAIESNEETVIAAAKEFKDDHRYMFIGSGSDWLLANEIALKMKENNYTSSIGMETEEFTHGSYPLFEEHATAALITHEGPSVERLLDVYHSAKHVHSNILVVGDDTVDQFPEANYKVKVASCGVEEIDSLACALPLQLFSYHISWAQGKDPDTLRHDDPLYGYMESTWIFPPGTH